MEFFHVISYRLWNSNYFSFGNPVPLKITKPHIRLILKFVNGIIFPVFRVLRKFEASFHNSWRCSSNSIQIFNYEWNSRGGREGRESKSRGKGRKDNTKGNKIRCRVMDTAYILGRNFSRAEREPRRFNKLAEVATKIRALFSREWIVTGRFNLWLPTFLVPLPRCRRLRGEKEEGGEREKRERTSNKSNYGTFFPFEARVFISFKAIPFSRNRSNFLQFSRLNFSRSLWYSFLITF